MGSKPAAGSPRILIVIPNWVGDVVLASPVLAAIRAHFADSRITYLMRGYVREIVEGCGWHDSELIWPRGGGIRVIADTWKLARTIRGERFDIALLLTNSFRSGLVCWMGGARRRVGYARDGRTLLLSDRLRPLKRGGEFVPAPVLDSYCKIAEHVGVTVRDRRLRLGITPAQEAAGAELARHYRLADRPYAIINPGAAFGASKCWPADRFAALCDRVHDELSLLPVVVGAPGEAALMRAIAEQAKRPLVCCDKPGTTLGSLKPLMRDARLLVCNDTGPRHYGAAFNVPTITIFGPTHQEWTDTDYVREIKLQEKVECGPCQLKVCPLDHRCMTRMTVENVLNASRMIALRYPAGGRDAANIETAEAAAR